MHDRVARSGDRHPDHGSGPVQHGADLLGGPGGRAQPAPLLLHPLGEVLGERGLAGRRRGEELLQAGHGGGAEPVHAAVRLHQRVLLVGGAAGPDAPRAHREEAELEWPGHLLLGALRGELPAHHALVLLQVRLLRVRVRAAAGGAAAGVLQPGRALHAALLPVLPPLQAPLHLQRSRLPALRLLPPRQARGGGGGGERARKPGAFLLHGRHHGSDVGGASAGPPELPPSQQSADGAGDGLLKTEVSKRMNGI